jgi:NAD-dependent SIR2 family protein deacetylase
MASDDPIRRAADAIAGAEAMLIGAGAGMGVDSGLPDFRGTQGFWRAYPLYEKLGLDFAAMVNPRWFDEDPTFAWGFYGHRLELYRRTAPHRGFAVLRGWAERMKHGAFVLTSNVDGQFQKAGFREDRIAEIHGSVHVVQCVRGCSGVVPGAPAALAPADPYRFEIDPETLRATGEVPRCARCAEVLRPNVLMFGDGWWDASRTAAQEARLRAFLDEVAEARVVVVECGAGTAIPSVRTACERLLRRGATLVRINVREPQVPPGGLPLAMGALEALERIAAEA